MSSDAFLDRVFSHLPADGGRFEFRTWRHGRQPTSEGVGVLPTPGADVEAVAARVLDFDRYAGNIDFVEECRVIADPRFTPPASTRFYQRVRVPMLATMHHELVLEDKGERDGWRVLAWHHLQPECSRLDPKRGARSDYNVGAWLVRPGRVAYALSTAPLKSDVGRLKYIALTRGADAGAPKVLQANIEGMVRWAKRS